MLDYKVRLPTPHEKQRIFINSPAKRKIIRAGRRSGKTEGTAIYNIEQFLAKKRVLYGAPTADQLAHWWTVVTRALAEPIKAGIFYKNETEHLIELPGTEQRIRGKTCWNSDTLRGDYCDLLVLDEWQLMSEDTWDTVGAPMLLDNDGNAIFIYTPPSLHSRSASKARDPRHAAKMYAKFDAEQKAGNSRYLALTFTSHDNPYLSKIALEEITQDMTHLAIRQEIMAEDIDEAPGALWHRQTRIVEGRTLYGIEDNRVRQAPELARIVIGVDPSGSSIGAECGIVGCGIARGGDMDGHHYTLADVSIQGSPDTWANAACTLYHLLKADMMAAERNYGGEMVEKVIKDTDPIINIKLVNATRGKAVRAEPISALCERGQDHIVGEFPLLEDELCQWVQGDKISPNRLDAKVWADTELIERGVKRAARSWQG